MNSKKIVYGEDAISKISKGVDTLANAVRVTLGPKGRHVAIMQESGMPIITKDGVTVAHSVKVKDAFEDVGVQLVKEVAQKTADVAGDGTTTATVLAQAIFSEGKKALLANANPIFVKKGIELAVEASIDTLRGMSKDIDADSLAAVATISANNDATLGNLIASAMRESGEDGVITVEESRTGETSMTSVEGMEIQRGYISPYFISNISKMTCEMDDCYILVADHDIADVKFLSPLLEHCAKNNKPLLIIADDVAGPALATMVINFQRGVLKCCAIKAPLFGEQKEEFLKDICAVTGAKLLSQKLGITLESASYHDFGFCRKVVVGKDATTLIDGTGKKEDIQLRIDMMKTRLDDPDTGSFEKEKIQERLAKLVGGVVVLNVGAVTETELKEKKARIEDALHATRAANEEGIVPGGGIGYLKAHMTLKNPASFTYSGAQKADVKWGWDIVAQALLAPIQHICKNAGVSHEVIISKLLSESSDTIGYDAVKEDYVDMFETGIIDPTKVCVSALQNAGSVAGLLLTTDATIVDDPDEDKGSDKPQQNYPMMM